MTETPGSTLVLDRYRLEERIGRGGSAEVWSGHDEQLGRRVAVKLLHPHLLPDEPSRERFRAEARSAAALAHPGIVSVYDVRATEQDAVIVFELIEGESLAARLEREGRLPEAEATEIAAQLADALDHAHRRGVVHRDVKPGNILLGEDGRARLVDFGIARSLEEGAARLTQTGTIVGTPRYMAPEQLRGERVTQQTDIYALGAVLYEMLAGHPPFEASTPVTIAEEQTRPPAPLAGVSTSLAAVTATALRPNPGERPRTAAALGVALRASLSNADTVVVAASVPAVPLAAAAVGVGGAAAALGTGESATTGSRANTSPRRSRLLVAIAGGVVGLLVIVLVTAVLAANALPAGGASSNPTVAPVPTARPTTVVTPAVEPPAHDKDDDGDKDDNRGRGNGNGNGRDRDDD